MGNGCARQIKEITPTSNRQYRAKKLVESARNDPSGRPL